MEGMLHTTAKNKVWVKNKPIPDNEWGSIWVASETFSCRAYVVVKKSIQEPSDVTMSLDPSDNDFALKSSKTVEIENLTVGTHYVRFQIQKWTK